ncbi:MAG: hypothetical protein WC668_03945 [Patescibacteria group bacterium]|jgi:hypothetical protein
MSESNEVLNDFIDYMAVNGSGWLLISHSDKVVNYQKQIPAKKGSCLLALLLLCCAIIPGILYLYFANKPAKTLNLTILLNKDGVVASGDPEGQKLYSDFIQSRIKVGQS